MWLFIETRFIGLRSELREWGVGGGESENQMILYDTRRPTRDTRTNYVAAAPIAGRVSSA